MYTLDNNNGLSIWDVKNLKDPFKTGELLYPADPALPNPGVTGTLYMPTAIAVKGNFAYIYDYRNVLYTVEITTEDDGRKQAAVNWKDHTYR